MTDSLVTRLREAIDETERIARAATDGPWHVDSEDYAEIIYGSDDTAVVSGGRWGGEASVFDSTADAIHIVRHDPAAVLRRCAADRKILDLHANDEGNCSTCHSEPEREVLWDGTDETWSWTSAALRFPCPTVSALAEAYGVEA